MRPVERVFFMAILLVASAAVSTLPAQLTTTTISGTLTDATGALVPNASVTAVEISTGTTTRALANGDGFYILSGLAPGQYRLRVEKPGFQVHVQEGVVVEVNRPVNVNVTLQVGATTQTLTVCSAAESGASIQKAFSAAKSTQAGYHWAQRLYRFVNRSLRFSA
jgi:hypothetical protein